MKTITLNVEVGNSDSLVLVAALEYAISRNSYAPSIVTEFLLDNWMAIPAAYRKLISEKVSEALSTNGPVNDWDPDWWVCFWKHFLEDVDDIETVAEAQKSGEPTPYAALRQQLELVDNPLHDIPYNDPGPDASKHIV